jgi:hypothetical protein
MLNLDPKLKIHANRILRDILEAAGDGDALRDAELAAM